MKKCILILLAVTLTACQGQQLTVFESSPGPESSETQAATELGSQAENPLGEEKSIVLDVQDIPDTAASSSVPEMRYTKDDLTLLPESFTAYEGTQLLHMQKHCWSPEGKAWMKRCLKGMSTI